MKLDEECLVDEQCLFRYTQCKKNETGLNKYCSCEDSHYRYAVGDKVGCFWKGIQKC